MVLAAKKTKTKIRQASPRGIEMELQSGSLEILVNEKLGGTGLKIHTPHGLVRVVGTMLRVSSDSGDTTVEVFRGRVRINEDTEIGAGRELFVWGRAGRGAISRGVGAIIWASSKTGTADDAKRWCASIDHRSLRGRGIG